MDCKSALVNADWDPKMALVILKIKVPIRRLITVKPSAEDEIRTEQRLSEESGWSIEDCTKIISIMGREYYNDILDFARSNPEGLESVL